MEKIALITDTGGDLSIRELEENNIFLTPFIISSGLSGTFNSLRLLCEDFEGLECFVYDSRGLTVIEGQLVLKISEMIKIGESFSEIVNEIPKIRESMHGYFTIDTLEYLQRGGRIGKIAGSLGSILQKKTYSICK